MSLNVEYGAYRFRVYYIKGCILVITEDNDAQFFVRQISHQSGETGNTAGVKNNRMSLLISDIKPKRILIKGGGLTCRYSRVEHRFQRIGFNDLAAEKQLIPAVQIFDCRVYAARSINLTDVKKVSFDLR